MKNIHILPTDKPSRLHNKNGQLGHIATKLYIEDFIGNKHNSFNIYITSDEPAYPYALHITNQEVLKVRAVGSKSLELYHDKGFSYTEECKKIILTTDQDLIKDGVQSIDDEFLEWFVKNPSCEEVETFIFGFDDSIIGHSKKYEIIIPKEEPKQETLEEAAEKLYPENWESIMEGQQQINYSEEEVLQLLLRLQQTESYDNLYDWFEQFKKK